MEDDDGSATLTKHRTMVLFMAIGTAIASVNTFEGFVLLAIFDFFLFALANYLRNKIILEPSGNFQETTHHDKHPFIFLGAEVKSDSSQTSQHRPNQHIAITPDERYIILASSNLHLKRIIFTIVLTAIQLFLLYKLSQNNLTMTSVSVLGGGMLCLTTLWYFFRIWQKGQFQLIMLINWCGVALMTKAPITVMAVVIPIYLVLSFQILQDEREYFGAASWATSWSYGLKFCAVWWLCLILMGSIAPNTLFRSLTKHLQTLSKLFDHREHAPRPTQNTNIQAKQSLEKISESLARQITNGSTTAQGSQQELFQKLLSQTKELTERIDQNDISPQELSQSLKNISEDIVKAQASAGSSSNELTELQSQTQTLTSEQAKATSNTFKKDLKELQSLAQRLSEEQTNSATSDATRIADNRENRSQETAVLPDQSSEPNAAMKNENKQVDKSWKRYKNLLFKLAVLLIIILLAKFFEKKTKPHDKELSQIGGTENFRKMWKNLLSKKLDPRTFVIEAYQLLAEANHAFLITDQPFSPPFVVYPDLPAGLFHKEWPMVANTFLSTLYGEKSITPGDLKSFANSADRLFSVYFTKSLDQAITKPNEDT